MGMKCLKVVLPIFIGTLVYSALTMLAGPRGIWPMNQLNDEKSRIAQNLDSLYGIRDGLNSQLQNLSADPDTISVYAHELGYVAEGEQLIKLTGFSGGIDRQYAPGSAISIRKPAYIPEWVCKFLGFFSAIAVFLAIKLLKNGGTYDHSKKRPKFG
jgi:hypothetical protein